MCLVLRHLSEIGRRIEDADARPPHHRLEFMRLGCTECWLWFSPGLRQDFAKTLLEFGDGVTMGRPSNHPPEGKNRPSEGKKSMSDRLGNSQEQSKSPEDAHFLVFFENFEQIWKNVRPRSGPRAPKSAQEAPKSVPRAPQERPGGSQDASRGAPGSYRGPF